MFFPVNFDKCFIFFIEYSGRMVLFPLSSNEILTKTLSNQSFRYALGSSLSENSWWWNPVLIKLQGNDSNTGLQYRCSLWAFPVLLWSLYAFVVFNREALLCSLSEPATHRSTKEQLLRNVPENDSWQVFLFRGVL